MRLTVCHSNRRWKVNCSDIRKAVLGAAQDKQGLILSAHGGSLFLDEITWSYHSICGSNYCVPYGKKIRPVGSRSGIDVDFRVISASHQDLELLVQQGRFRQDLFFRIHVMDIVLPPLRERGQDLLLLASAVQKISRGMGTPAKPLSSRAEPIPVTAIFPRAMYVSYATSLNAHRPPVMMKTIDLAQNSPLRGSIATPVSHAISQRRKNMNRLIQALALQ